jgi:hypothetical protein
VDQDAPKGVVGGRVERFENDAEGIVHGRGPLLPEAEDHVVDGIGSKADREHSEREEEPSIAKRKHLLDRHDNLPSAGTESSPAR